jgi:hypothetical protein
MVKLKQWAIVSHSMKICNKTHQRLEGRWPEPLTHMNYRRGDAGIQCHLCEPLLKCGIVSEDGEPMQRWILVKEGVTLAYVVSAWLT